MDVFDLVAKLSLDSSEYEDGLSGAEEKASTFGSGVKTAMKVGTAAIAAVGTAAVGLGVSFTKSVGSLAEYGDNIDKTSQKIGISAEAYQEWDAVLQHSGASADSLKAVMKTLSNQAVKSAEEFQQLGISEEEVANLSKEDLFAKVVTGLQEMEEGTEKTAIATKLLGRGATEFGALLNTSAEETQAMRDRVHELGGVMSDEAVKASAKYQDTLQDMTTAFSGLKRTMMSEFLPSVTTVMEGLTEIFAGNYDEGLTQIGDGVNDIVNNISEVLPKVTEVGGQIVTSLIDAFSQNLPVLLNSAVGIIMSLGDALIQNAPMIVSSGLEIIVNIADSILNNLPTIVETGLEVMIEFAEGLSKAIPKMIPTVVNIVVQIVQIISKQAPKLVVVALELAQALFQGLVDAIPTIVEAIPQIVQALVEMITGGDSIMQIIDGTIELFTAMLDALPDIIEQIVGMIPEIITAIVTALMKATPQLVEAGVKLFVALIKSAPKIISTIISLIPTIVTSLVQGFQNSMPQIESAGVRMFTGLANAIPKIITTLKAEVPKIISNIVSTLSNGVSQLKTVGENLIIGLYNGINNKVQWVIGLVGNLAQSIINKAKSAFKESSPSKVFYEIGDYLGVGLGMGWEDSIEEVNKQIDKDLNYKGSIDITANTAVAGAGITGTSQSSSLTESDIDRLLSKLSINLYNTTEIDGNAIKKESYKYTVTRMGDETRAMKVAMGVH